MTSAAFLLAASVISLEAGWQPGEDGQLEYLIQVEPTIVEQMLGGLAINSDVEPTARTARRYRILVGVDKLPRWNSQAQMPKASKLAPALRTYWEGRDQGIEAGYRQENGRIEYVVQVHPELMDRLMEEGTEVAGLIPDSIPQVNRFTLQVGTTPLTGRTGTTGRPVSDRLGASQAGSNGTAGGFRSQFDRTLDDDQWGAPAASRTGGGYGRTTASSGSSTTSRRGSTAADSYLTRRAPTRGSTWDDRYASNEAKYEDDLNRRPTASQRGTSRVSTYQAGYEDEPRARKTSTRASSTVPKTRSTGSTPTLGDADTTQPLVVTSLALFASLAANLYMVWVFRDMDRRYRSLLGEMRRVRAVAA